MKVELTIKVDYLPSWGLQEGVRELLQNAKDAETELSAPMSVRMRDNVLVIENEGCTMPYEALLLGHTTKSDRGDLIGKFGEGFKLGILALLRIGHTVKIRNGSEVWIPEIVQSEKFGARVLAFDIAKGRKAEDRVQIEISGISPDFFRDNIKPRFLWLDKDGRRKEDSVETYSGSLLLSEHHKGKIFVKGILVETKPTLMVGYDLNNAAVDRDRKMVESYDFAYEARRVWKEALNKRPELSGSFVALLSSNSDEVRDMASYTAADFPLALRERVAASFVAEYGANSIPVSNLNEAVELEHFGRRGVIVNRAMRSMLETTMGELSKVQEALKTEEIRVYQLDELFHSQRENLERAIRLVSLASPVSLANVSVVDFRSANLHGLYCDGAIKLALRVVNERADCLATLVHEVAHHAGSDGSHEHVAEIERIWSVIVESMVNNYGYESL